MALEDPNVMLENPSTSFPSSVSLNCSVPVAPVPRPIVVLAVFGAIVNVDVPERFAPISSASEVMESAFAPIAIEPLAPIDTVFAVMLVEPSTFDPPTAPLMATVAVPASIPTVLAELLSKLLIVPLNVILLFVVLNTVFLLIKTALLNVCVPTVVTFAVSITVVPPEPVKMLLLVTG